MHRAGYLKKVRANSHQEIERDVKRGKPHGEARVPDLLRRPPEEGLSNEVHVLVRRQLLLRNVLRTEGRRRPGAGGAAVIERWLKLAAGYPFPVLMETHRNSTLNDLFYTLEVLNQVPDLRLCADLSHFVVDRELQLPLEEPDKGYFSRVIERSDSFQGRISNNQQIQIAIEHTQHAPWVQQYLSWWEEGMSAWSQRATPSGTLRFLVELGPPPYAITDAAHQELSDRWQEGLMLREWVEAIWKALPSR